MSPTLEQILANLSDFPITETSDTDPDKPMKGIRFLPDSEEALLSEYIYLGKESVFESLHFNQADSIFFLIRDLPVNLLTLKPNSVIFPEGTDMVVLFQAVQRLFDAQYKLRDCSAEIFNSFVKGEGIQGILKVGLKILGNPLLLSDSSSKLIAVSSNTEIQDPIVKDILTFGFSSQNFMNQFQLHRITEQMEASPNPILLDWGIFKDARRIVGKITFHNKMIANLLVLETDRQFSEIDFDIIHLLCNAISLEMSSNKSYTSYTGEIHENIMIDLLEGNGTPGAVQNKIRSLHWKRNQSFCILAVMIPKIDSAYSYLEYTKMRIKISVPGCQIVYYEPYLVLLYSPKDQPHAVHILSSLRNLFSERKLVAGAGLPFDDIMDLKKHFLEAVRSIELGREINDKETLFEYDNYFIYDILSLVENQTDLVYYFNHHFKVLLQYDKANGTDYYDTLREYLKHGLNKVSAAKTLFIHRNTMDYRVNKISELLQADLSDGDICLKLYLCYKIAERYGLKK